MVSTTAASSPCRSVYKTIFLSGDTPFFREGQEAEAEKYWLIRELVIRSTLTKHEAQNHFLNGMQEVEATINAKTNLLGTGNSVAFDTKPGITSLDHTTKATVQELAEHNHTVWECEAEFFGQSLEYAAKTIKGLTPNSGTVFFKQRWRAVNEGLIRMAKGLEVI